MKNIAIEDGTHERLCEDAARHNNAKLYSMVSAYQRGWAILSDEQRHSAITGRSAVADPEPFATGNPDCIQGDSLQATAGCLALARVIERAMRDGKLDAGELSQVITEAMKTDRQLRKIVADCQELARRNHRAAKAVAA